MLDDTETPRRAGRGRIAGEPPDNIDVHVGNRVRTRRVMLGVSQSQLANVLGISFQQVQKYERGTNRLSASKLYHTAAFLNSPIQYFFDGLATGEALLDEEPASTRMILEVSKNLALLSPDLRRVINEMTKSLIVDDVI